MTSKSLCFKLMREDLKRRVWTIALTVLGLVFTLLVPVALQSSSYMDMVWEKRDLYYQKRLAQQLIDMVGVNGLVITVLLAAAVVWAVSGFRYLHNSRQVDFYHSIPVKRHQLFIASYLNGILVPMAIYLAVQVLSVALIMRTDIGSGLLGNTWWKMFLINLVYYSMMYTTTVIAMMMTGNLIIALLGTIVFCSYGPAVASLVVLYQSAWFHTYFATEARMAAWKRVVNYSSPFANYMFSIADFSYDSLGIRRIAGAVLVTVVLAMIAYGLYRIRPSESAGKAMAFKKTESPIKHLIALPVGVVFGMFFYELRSTLPWAVFGVLCGVGLTCCIMEIIYHFEFRKLFANWIHLAACFGISLLLILAGMYDWYGYDSWLPDGTSIKSAAVIFNYDDDWVTYGDVRMDTDYAGRERAVWRYEEQTDYGFEHMELTDIYTVMELAKKGVESDKRSRRENYTDSWLAGAPCVVEYRLNNGKCVYRQYHIADEELKPLKTAVYDNREYKKGIYPVLSQTGTDTASVWFQQYGRKEKLDVTPEEISRLLTVYQKELEELSMDAREKELPIGTIQFRSQNLENGIAFNKENNGYGLEERCYYPVYPSFAETLKELKKAGASLARLDTDTVENIRIVYFWDPDEVSQEEDGDELRERTWGRDYDRAQAETYREKEDIEKLIPALVYGDYYNMNSYYEMESPDNAEVYVTTGLGMLGVQGDRNGDPMEFRINMKKLSQGDIDRFRLGKAPN